MIYVFMLDYVHVYVNIRTKVIFLSNWDAPLGDGALLRLCTLRIESGGTGFVSLAYHVCTCDVIMHHFLFMAAVLTSDSYTGAHRICWLNFTKSFRFPQN